MFAIIISSVGASAGILLALAILAQDRARSPRTWYLFVAILLLASTQIEDALAAARYYDSQPFLFGWSYPALCLLGPLVWLHVAALSDPLGSGWRRARLHLLGALAILLIATPWLFSGALRWAIERGGGGAAAEVPSFSLLVYLLVAAAQQLLYLIAARRRAVTIVAPRERRWVVLLVTPAAVAWVTYAATLLAVLVGIEGGLAVGAANAALTLSIYGLAVASIVWPPDPLTAAPTEASIKYARSAMTEADIDRMMKKIDQARASGVHREPTCTLQSLARRTGASPNSVSQALNVRAGGFHDWLATVRIEDALSLLVSAPDGSDVMDVAYAVGFNSKSTFYDAFRRVTGQTPAAWRAASRGA